MTKPLLTYTSASVAKVLLSDPDAEYYGVQIYKLAGITAGTVYPMLEEWHKRGWLKYRDETPEQAQQRGSLGPRRRYVKLTKKGLTDLTDYIQRWDAQQGRYHATK